ncbi:MAG: hypothetical protein JWR61_149 [Ferruginibacter sp.]|nr:hypothetical protein [Ferruginibacter sp.]
MLNSPECKVSGIFLLKNLKAETNNRLYLTQTSKTQTSAISSAFLSQFFYSIIFGFINQLYLLP